MDTCQGFKQVRSKFYPRFIQADVKKPLKTRFFLDKLKWPKLKTRFNQEDGLCNMLIFGQNPEVYKQKAEKVNCQYTGHFQLKTMSWALYQHLLKKKKKHMIPA